MIKWFRTGGHTHSKQSGWWFFWSGCLGGSSVPSRCSRQCACGGSLWCWSAARCTPGSRCRTRRTDWLDWTELDTTKKHSLSPERSILALLNCTESHLPEEHLDQLEIGHECIQEVKATKQNLGNLLLSVKLHHHGTQYIVHIVCYHEQKVKNNPPCCC